jgi:outer membrane protein
MPITSYYTILALPNIMHRFSLVALLNLALWLVALTTNALPTPTSWGLDQCIDHALKNNIQVKIYDLTRQTTVNNYLQSKISLLPTLSSDASYSFNFGNSVNPTSYQYQQVNSQSMSLGLTGNLNLFTGLQQINNIQRTKQDLLAAGYDLGSTMNTTALTVANYFLQVVLNKELVTSSTRQVDLSQAQLDIAKSKVKAGTLAEAVLYDFEAQVSRDNATLISQQNTLNISLLTLKIALQLPDQNDFDIAVPEINMGRAMEVSSSSAQTIYDYAAQRQPSIQAAEARVKSAAYSIKYAKGALSPTFSMGFSLRSNYYNQSNRATGGYDTIWSPIFTAPSAAGLAGFSPNLIPKSSEKIPIGDQLNTNLTKSINFSMNLPLFSGWKRMTAIANSKLQYQIQSLNVESAKNTLRKDIYQAHANARSNQQSYVANTSTLASQRKAYEAAQKRYAAGLGTTLDLQQSQTNLAKAESAAIQAKYNYVFSAKVLDFYQGKTITLNDLK